MTGLVMGNPRDTLVGTDKVVALLLSIDQDVARCVLKHFDQSELRQLAKRASTLGNVAARAIEPVINDMLEQLSANAPDLVIAPDTAEQLLTGVIPPEAVAEIMSDVLGNSNQFFWQRLSSVSENTLASYLANEHPQTIAAVLTKLDTSFAATVLSEMDGAVRNCVIRRMLVSRPVSDAAIRILETTLQEDLLGAQASNAGSGSRSLVAGIINQMDRVQIEEALQTIEDSEPMIAKELRSLVFSFEDIPKLSERARSVLFDKVPTDRLILARRGAEEVVRAAALPILGARVRRMVEAELATGDAPPQRDILKAQRLIANTVLQLSEEGVIEIAPQAPDSTEFS
jgi:flagellar motor switch protein FliG